MSMDADILRHYASLSTPDSPKAHIDDLIEENDATAVRALLEAGFDLNKRNHAGDSPLQVACRFGAEEVVRLLLERGAEVNAKGGENYTPLHEACLFNNPAIARLLLEKGADMNAKTTAGDTALMWSCLNLHVAVVRVLLEARPDLACVNNAGLSALAITMEQPAGPSREEIIDLFRQYAPEQVVEAYCTIGVDI